MKKFLSVFLAIFILAASCVPAIAADDVVTSDNIVAFEHKIVMNDDGSRDWYHGYCFVKSVDGEIQYEQDDGGIYVYYEKGGMFSTWDDLFDYNKPENPVWYSPDEISDTYVPDGTVISFKVWSLEYNLATAFVTVNGTIVEPDENGEYTITVEDDTTIALVEKYENGEDVLLRNHYTIQLASGEGFACKPLSGQNYQYVYYGDDFYFRVKIDEGYSGSGMSVGVTRGIDILTEYLEDDADLILEVLNKAEPLTAYGVDSDGYRLYKIENITSDCRIVVTGVDEADDGFMTMIKRILRLILNFFGIKMDFLETMVAYYNVSVANQSDAQYTLLLGVDDYSDQTAFTAVNGQGIVLTVTKKSLEDDVTVLCNNQTIYDETTWVAEYNDNGELVYSAVFYIDSIAQDTNIVIK